MAQIAAIEIQVPGPPGPGPSELLIAQLMLGQADTDNKVLFMGPNGSRVADSFETTDGIDLVHSSYVDTSESGTIKPAVSAPIPIPDGEGTPIGDMSSNGGIAAPFNGIASKTTAQSAYSPATGAYLGKTFATPHKIKRITIRAASDFGFDGSPATGRIQFSAYGRVGAGPDIYLGSASSFTDAPGSALIIDSLDFATEFDRVSIVEGSQLGGCCVAQIILEKPGTIAPMTLRSKVFDINFIPTRMKSVIYADLPVAAQINDDLVMAFSRDGGAHLAPTTLTLRSSVSDTKHVFESDEVDLTGQPSAMQPCWQIDTFGLLIPIRAVFCYAIP